MIPGKCFMQIHSEEVVGQVSVDTEAMMGKKKLAPLTPLLLCVANID